MLFRSQTFLAQRKGTLSEEAKSYWQQTADETPMTVVRLQARAAAISARVAALKTEMETLSQQIVQGSVKASLSEEKLQTFRKSYFDLLRQFQVADQRVSALTPPLQVLDQPHGDPIAVSVHSFRKVLIAAFLALGLGLAWILGVDYIRRAKQVNQNSV